MKNLLLILALACCFHSCKKDVPRHLKRTLQKAPFVRVDPGTLKGPSSCGIGALSFDKKEYDLTLEEYVLCHDSLPDTVKIKEVGTYRFEGEHWRDTEPWGHRIVGTIFFTNTSGETREAKIFCFEDTGYMELTFRDFPTEGESGFMSWKQGI